MPKKYSIKFLPRAKSELDEISNWIIKDCNDPWAADIVIRKITQKINELTIFPNGHPLVESADMKENSLRMTHVDQYNIFFKVHDNFVVIYSIMHAHQKIG